MASSVGDPRRPPKGAPLAPAIRRGLMRSQSSQSMSLSRSSGSKGRLYDSFRNDNNSMEDGFENENENEKSINNDKDKESSKGGFVIEYDEDGSFSSQNSHNFDDDDDDDSKTNRYSRGDGGSTDDDESQIEIRRITSRENRAICCLRGSVVTVMIATGILVSIVVYIVSRDGEVSNFENQFEGHAHKIIDSFHDRLTRNIGAVDTLTVSMTSKATTGQRPWPFVVYDGFAQEAATIREITSAESIVLLPVVKSEQSPAWEAHTATDFGWVAESRAIESNTKLDDQDDSDFAPYLTKIFRQNDEDEFVFEDGPGPFLPVWYNSPIESTLVNYNANSSDVFDDNIRAVLTKKKAVLGATLILDPNRTITGALNEVWSEGAGSFKDTPFSTINFPIFEKFLYPSNDTGAGLPDVVAIITLVTYWGRYFEDTFTEQSEAKDIVVVVKHGDCGMPQTFILNGPNATYLGNGDLSDPYFDYLEISSSISVERRGIPFGTDFCPYSIHVFPSIETREHYTTIRPGIYTLAVLIIFIFPLLIFLAYDLTVERRQTKVLKTALENRAIVASLFPSAIRDRLFNNNSNSNRNNNKSTMSQFSADLDSVASGIEPDSKRSGAPAFERSNSGLGPASNEMISQYMKNGKFHRDDAVNDAQPIADNFTNSTVLFADIAGFTAWSSQREPTQVFTLLQTLYQAFDKLAKKLGVFKIETIGDCYVAVTGLPEPQDDHALRMARFARECIYRMHDLVKKLEVTLGPDTGELCMRVGMHSGPVTAGVLRGEKSRFQLFGDTVNTAARMESTGIKNRIQVSQDTANLLREGGKGSWLTKREDVVTAKGKGQMQTYWVKSRSRNWKTREHRTAIIDDDRSLNAAALGDISSAEKDLSLHGSSHGSKRKLRPSLSAMHASIVWNNSGSNHNAPDRVAMDRLDRLIDWHVDLFSGLLKRVVAHRIAIGADILCKPIPEREETTNPLDEMVEILDLPPPARAKVTPVQVDPTGVYLSAEVLSQVKEFIQVISGTYRTNHFHNFAHASHVTMSANKLMNRIVRRQGSSDRASKSDEDVFEFTELITSNPLVHLSIVFGALIHDVDHTGASNAQLVAEKSKIAALYNGKSVAEQNSFDIVWEILMDPRFKDLRNCIWANEKDHDLFRQIVINTVLSTDIFDKDMKEARVARWEKAFMGEEHSYGRGEFNRLRATLVLELVIQGSDVVHTMQHYDIYRKWNDRLFCEMVAAYKEGRCPKNPVEGWYEGEIGFFEHVIIPLSGKFLDSGAFGVTGTEGLNYAVDNFTKWIKEGKDCVNEMVEKHCPDLAIVVEESEGEKGNGMGSSDEESKSPEYYFGGDVDSSDDESFGGEE